MRTGNAPVDAYREAREAVGDRATPVLVGPITFVLLGKYHQLPIAEHVRQIVPIYQQLLADLAAAGEAITRRFGWRLGALERSEGEWVARDPAGAEIARAPVAILANGVGIRGLPQAWLLYTSPSPRDRTRSRMPSSA